MNDFELRRSLARLPRKREPARDLWPDIAARMADRADARRSRPRWPWLTLAAAALLALALLPQTLRHAGVVDTPVQATAQTPDASTPPSPWPAGDAIVVGGAWNLPTWMLADPDVAAALDELESSTVELHRLIEAHPQASHLVSLLHGTYQQHRWLNRFGVGQMQIPPPQES